MPVGFGGLDVRGMVIDGLPHLRSGAGRASRLLVADQRASGTAQQHC
jgi:hypothetical protein